MADVSCERCADRLGDYVDGVLALDARRALEQHLAACPACASLLREYRDLPRIVRRATDTGVPLDVERRLRRALAVFRPARR